MMSYVDVFTSSILYYVIKHGIRRFLNHEWSRPASLGSSRFSDADDVVDSRYGAKNLLFQDLIRQFDYLEELYVLVPNAAPQLNSK
jgi:hypothetical protein